MLSSSDILKNGQQLDKLYTKVISQVSAKFGMSKIEVDILLFLYNHPDYDTARDIVEVRCIAKSYVSKAVDLLMQRGYLTSMEDKKDRRILHLFIQASADNIIREAKEAQELFMSIIGKGIPEEDQEVLERILSRVSENIRQAFL